MPATRSNSYQTYAVLKTESSSNPAILTRGDHSLWPCLSYENLFRNIGETIEKANGTEFALNFRVKQRRINVLTKETARAEK